MEIEKTEIIKLKSFQKLLEQSSASRGMFTYQETEQEPGMSGRTGTITR